jgi:flavodoxin/NAD-dependent dihydropyrimidine dehydrogenase PreA subunit
MSTCLIVYFSQGRTTGKIAVSIAKGLGASDHSVSFHNLKDGPPPDQRSYDILGIGCPSHYYRPAIVMSDYLESLPDLVGKPVFSFILYGAYSGDAGNMVRHMLEQKNGKEMGYARYHGAGIFLGYLREGHQFSSSHPKPDELSQAEEFGGEIAARVAGEPYAKTAYDAPTPMIYRLERFLTNRFLIKHMYSRLFNVNKRTCNTCGLCMKVCPARNIGKDNEDRPVWGRDCILCFACEAQCPKDAIGSPVTWLMFKPFTIYNIRAALHDPALEHTRVTHAHGRTTVKERPV